LAGCTLGVVEEDLPIRTAVFVTDRIIGEISFPELVQLVRVVGLLGGKAWIATAELRIGYNRFQLLFLKKVTTVGFREVIGIGQQGGRSELLLQNPYLVGRLEAVLDEGFQLIPFELSSYGVGI
jgi:hypothetical protein